VGGVSAFSEYVNQAARSAGYDLSGPRSGGKKALAQAAGMGQTAVGRMLAGVCLPDPYALPRLAAALSVPVEDLLRLVGLLPEAGKDTGGATQAPAGESAQPALDTTPLAIHWDRTVIHPDADPTDNTIVCCLVTDTRQPVALLLNDEHREALGLLLVEPDDPDAPAPDADDEVMRTVRRAIVDFDFADYGLDDTDPTSEYAEWVGDLASAIAGALGGESA
jgi:hypothetical protein